MDLNETIHKLSLDLWNASITRYLEQELFSIKWWGIIVFLTIIYFVWWKLTDKARLMEILLFGSFVAVSALFLDTAGVSMGWVQFNIRILPFSPLPFPFDYTVIPILLMLAYQYTNSWWKFFIATVLSGIGFSFVLLPLSQVLGIRAFYNWKYIYTFMVWLPTAFLSRFIILQVLRKVHASKSL